MDDFTRFAINFDGGVHALMYVVIFAVLGVTKLLCAVLGVEDHNPSE